MKKICLLLIILLGLPILLTPNITAVIIHPDVNYTISNVTYNMQQTMNFSKIIINDSYICFNNTKILITSPNPMTINLIYLHSDPANITQKETTVLSFYATTPTGLVTFIIGGQQLSTYYGVKVDNVLKKNTITSNNTGFITFTHNIWSRHRFDIIYNPKIAPTVRFTYTSIENKVTLIPILSYEVTDYKWNIINKRLGYTYETSWIPYDEQTDHITLLDTGIYLITITGRNTTTGLTDQFTNEVRVNVKEDYVEPLQTTPTTKERESFIINHLPEPLKSFFMGRSDFEMMLIIIGFLLLLLFITRRKKVKKYVKLERVEYDR